MNSNQKRRDARAASHRSDDGEAFLPDPSTANRHNALGRTDAESFAEEFIASATAGEPVEMEAQDEVVDEEWGGPFLELNAEEGEGEGSEGAAEERAEGAEGAEGNRREWESLRAIPEPPALHRLPPRLH